MGGGKNWEALGPVPQDMRVADPLRTRPSPHITYVRRFAGKIVPRVPPFKITQGHYYLILHSLICRVLLLLLLLRNASDLRNCTSYFGACMWVWYCRPPIGAHFHPTPQPPTVPQQLGEKAHLRTVAAVLTNATGDARRRLQAGARRPAYTGPSSRTAARAGDRR